MSWSKQTQAASGGGAVTQATIPWVVDGSGVTQTVSGTFYPVTQPVSAASLPLPVGAALDSSLGTIATDIALLAKLTDTQPVSLASLPALVAGSAVIGHVIVDSGSIADSGSVAVTNFPASQAVSIAAPVGVTGTFYQAIQPISGTVTLIGEALEALRPPRQKLGRDALHPRRGILRRKHQYA